MYRSSLQVSFRGYNLRHDTKRNDWFEKWKSVTCENLCEELLRPQGWIGQFTISVDRTRNLANNRNDYKRSDPDQNSFFPKFLEALRCKNGNDVSLLPCFLPREYAWVTLPTWLSRIRTIHPLRTSQWWHVAWHSADTLRVMQIYILWLIDVILPSHGWHIDSYHPH